MLRNVSKATQLKNGGSGPVMEIQLPSQLLLPTTPHCSTLDCDGKVISYAPPHLSGPQPHFAHACVQAHPKPEPEEQGWGRVEEGWGRKGWTVTKTSKYNLVLTKLPVLWRRQIGHRDAVRAGVGDSAKHQPGVGPISLWGWVLRREADFKALWQRGWMRGQVSSNPFVLRAAAEVANRLCIPAGVAGWSD